MRKRRSLTVAAVGVALAAASGCGSPQTDAARSTAVAFERALRAGDTARACDLLAPKTKSALVESAGKPCPQALAEEGLPDAGAARESAAFGTMAQIRFERDVLFMAEFQGGWKVHAAGCAHRPGRPYDCTVGS